MVWCDSCLAWWGWHVLPACIVRQVWIGMSLFLPNATWRWPGVVTRGPLARCTVLQFPSPCMGLLKRPE